MKIKVIVTLKNGVLDPQGKAIQQTLNGMNFNNVGEVRQGKFFEIEIKEKDETKAKSFSNLLNSLNYKNKLIYNDELKNKLGTSFYSIGVYTSGGVLLNPGKLEGWKIKESFKN